MRTAEGKEQAIDTYEKLEAVCHVEMRSKIDQLKVLIDRAYQNLVIQDEKN